MSYDENPEYPEYARWEMVRWANEVSNYTQLTGPERWAVDRLLSTFGKPPTQPEGGHF